MEIKKFEAPTMQEALDAIKRELGPEAIILQTRKNKKGFGLMSKESVEVTAAVSERSLQKKQYAEKRLPEPVKSALRQLPAGRQAEFYGKYSDDAPPPKSRAAGAAASTAPRPRQGRAGAAAAAAYGGGTSTLPEPARQPTAYASDVIAQASHDRIEVSSTRAPGRPVAQAPEQDFTGGTGAYSAGAPVPGKPAVTPTRYIDIDDEEDSVASPARGTSKASGMTVEDEVRHLKRMIEELKSSQDSRGLSGSGAEALAGGMPGTLATPALLDAFEQLVVNGVEKRYALQLLRQVALDLGAERTRSPDHVLDQLAAEIMRTTLTHPPLASVRPRERRTERGGEPLPGEGPELSPTGAAERGPVVIALVGPTGVGKTTTVAKMASEALLRRSLRVGLINLDSFKIAAFDQLATYAKILNVPFRSVTKREDLRAALQDFRGLDLVLVDTTGRSQRDPGSLQELRELLGPVPELRTQLVLAATTRDNELYDMASRFAVFRPEGVSVTKLDEATLHGSLYNVHQRVKLPLLYFTTGQRVPEDIEEATPERVAAMILDL